MEEQEEQEEQETAATATSSAAADGGHAPSRLPPRPAAASAGSAPTAGKRPYVKRRERDFPHVQWDQALAYFAACVRLELQELTAEFVARVRLVLPTKLLDKYDARTHQLALAGCRTS